MEGRAHPPMRKGQTGTEEQLLIGLRCIRLDLMHIITTPNVPVELTGRPHSLNEEATQSGILVERVEVRNHFHPTCEPSVEEGKNAVMWIPPDATRRKTQLLYAQAAPFVLLFSPIRLQKL